MNPYSPSNAAEATSSPMDMLFDLRVARRHLKYAIAMVPVFAFMLVGSVGAAYWNVGNSFPNHRVWVIGFAFFWGSWLSCSVFLLWRCLRFRVQGTERHIKCVGVLRATSLPLGDVKTVRWSCCPHSGSVLLRGDIGRIKIDFGMLDFLDRNPLAEWLHRNVPLETQANWDEFQKRVVNTEWPKKQMVYDLM